MQRCHSRGDAAEAFSTVMRSRESRGSMGIANDAPKRRRSPSLNDCYIWQLVKNAALWILKHVFALFVVPEAHQGSADPQGIFRN